MLPSGVFKPYVEKIMKKSSSIFFVLTLVSSVVFAGGIDDPKASSAMAIMKKDNNHIQLFYKSVKSATVEISIYDSDNALRFSETIRKVDGFIRPYDLSKMEEGDYTIVVKDGDRSLIEKVSTHRSKVKMFSQVVKMKGDADRFLVTVADKTSSSVTVQVVDASSKVIFEHKENMNDQYSKIFSFPNRIDGCTFLVTNDRGETNTFEK